MPSFDGSPRKGEMVFYEVRFASKYQPRASRANRFSVEAIYGNVSIASLFHFPVLVTHFLSYVVVFNARRISR